MDHGKAANGPREGSQWAMMPYMHKPTAMASNGSSMPVLSSWVGKSTLCHGLTSILTGRHTHVAPLLTASTTAVPWRPQEGRADPGRSHHPV